MRKLNKWQKEQSSQFWQNEQKQRYESVPRICDWHQLANLFPLFKFDKYQQCVIQRKRDRERMVRGIQFPGSRQAKQTIKPGPMWYKNLFHAGPCVTQHHGISMYINYPVIQSMKQPNRHSVTGLFFIIPSRFTFSLQHNKVRVKSEQKKRQEI